MGREGNADFLDSRGPQADNVFVLVYPQAVAAQARESVRLAKQRHKKKGKTDPCDKLRLKTRLSGSLGEHCLVSSLP
jgi:hypothetical protein